MISVGIIGENSSFETMTLLKKLYESKGLKVFAKNTDKLGFDFSYDFPYFEKLDTDIFLLSMNYSCVEENKIKGVKFNVLIYLEGITKDNLKKRKLPNFLEEKNIIIVNSDNKDVFPFLISSGTTLITCGLNSKASITLSSLICEDDIETIQCCIQRAITTISGEKLEPQEFTVNVKSKTENVTGVLAAVAAAIADDVEISELSLSLL